MLTGIRRLMIYQLFTITPRLTLKKLELKLRNQDTIMVNTFLQLRYMINYPNVVNTETQKNIKSIGFCKK